MLRVVVAASVRAFDLNWDNLHKKLSECQSARGFMGWHRKRNGGLYNVDAAGWYGSGF